MKATKTIRWLRFVFLLLLATVIFLIFKLTHFFLKTPDRESKDSLRVASWYAPDTLTIPPGGQGNLIRYGRKLIANTSHYLGPKGIIVSISNAMNCQNCHLEAGTKGYGNSFYGVASTYPVFRPRSGIIESIEFRINDCFKRSMNGKTLDTGSYEMHAMVAFIKWIGQGVPKGTKPKGAGIVEPAYLDRPADTLRGRIVYENKCRVCHGRKGEGFLKTAGEGFVYPPLWGAQSYNTGAGLFRLGRFAGFVKFSMPMGATFDAPLLTDAEAWDVAAFVNSQPRPEKVFSGDWPDIRRKAVDYPYGPFADGFSEDRHKYGPFGALKRVQDSLISGAKPSK